MSDFIPVHCESHGAVHMSDWCTCGDRAFTKLESKTLNEAVEECRAKGLWLYSDWCKTREKTSGSC